MTEWKIFLDFDGTITRVDVGVMLLDRFGPSDWRKYDDQYEKGEINMRECLNKEWEGFSGTIEEVNSEIIPKVEVEKGFIDFINRMYKKGIPLIIVSDGFVSYIELIFSEKKIKREYFDIYANEAEYKNGKVSLKYITDECEHGCANCKVYFVKKAQEEGYKVIYVGDGISDFTPARVADIIFAKHNRSLERFCQKNKIHHYPFNDFLDILAILNDFKFV